MRWAGPGRDQQQQGHKQAGSQAQAASSACTGTAALGRLGVRLLFAWFEQRNICSPIQSNKKLKTMLDRMHAKAIDNFSCCSVAYLSCTACFASFAFALLSFVFVLLCTASSAPAAASSLLLQYNACPQPVFFFSAFTFTSSDHVLLAVLALAAS